MPRFVINAPARTNRHDSLVRKLADELRTTTPMSPSAALQPLILEERIDATGSRHVYVIWDKWRDLSDDDRSQVIVEAYSQAEGTGIAEQITIAAGVTPVEALALGLLPWKVVRQPKKGLVAPDMKVLKAHKAELLKTLLGKSAKELRYARAEDADDARKRLESAAPGSQWMLVKEEMSEG